MNKALALLPLGLVGLLFSCSPDQPTASFPSQEGESDYSSFVSRQEAAQRKVATADGMKIDAHAAGTLYYESGDTTLDLSQLEASFSLTAAGLNEGKVSELALGATSEGTLALSVGNGSSSADLNTPIDASLFLREGQVYLDLTKIAWSSIVGDSSSLPPVFADKVVSVGLESDQEAASTAEELRTMADDLFFGLAEGAGEETTYYEYADGSVGFEAPMSKDALALIIAQNVDPTASMEDMLVLAAEIAGGIDLTTFLVKVAYGEDLAHLSFDVDLTLDMGEGETADVDMTLDMGAVFSDELDVEFPTDLDTYVEA